MKNTFAFILFSFGLLLAPLSSSIASDLAGNLALAQILSSELGVTDAQATGGAGAIFQTAKDKLKPSEFSQIADAVPGMDKLLAAAPKQESSATGDLLKSGASLLGGSDSSASSLASLASSFSSLDMDSSMVGKFMPVILDYVKTNGSDMAMSLLKKAIS